MSQKINLAVADTFSGGEKLLDDEMKELGLDGGGQHLRIEFDNEKTAKYCLCKVFVVALSTVYLWIIFPFFIPCIMYNIRKWTESRLAAVTDKQLVLKQGYYGCCCCCWNEKTKSVPLDKITDLQIQQGCIQRCYDIKEIRVETASANQQAPEMQLVGLKDAHEIRTMVLKVRDNQNIFNNNTYSTPKGNTGSVNNNNNNSSSYNPLLPDNDNQSTKQLEQLISTQHQTMVQIKDVLTDMKKALVSMDNKMNKGDNLSAM